MFLIGVVNKHCLAAHTQDLITDTREKRLSPECQGSVNDPATYGTLNYLREAHQHQQGEEIGAFERLWQLLNAVVGESSDDGAPLRAGIQTVQDVCHSARPIQTYTAGTQQKAKFK